MNWIEKLTMKVNGATLWLTNKAVDAQMKNLDKKKWWKFWKKK